MGKLKGNLDDIELIENKEWYMAAVEGCLVLRGMTKKEAKELISSYQLKERLDTYTDLQLHYDIEVTADEILSNNAKQYDRYLKALENTPEPVASRKLCKIDYDALIDYAKEKGIAPSDLSNEEKKRFFRI